MKKQKTKSKPAKEKKKPSYNQELHKKIETYIAKQKRDWFFSSDLKRHIHNGRTDIGGGKFLKKLIIVFRLERKKEDGRILLKVRK